MTDEKSISEKLSNTSIDDKKPKWNLGAASFVPNAGAAEFVPGSVDLSAILSQDTNPFSITASEPVNVTPAATPSTPANTPAATAPKKKEVAVKEEKKEVKKAPVKKIEVVEMTAEEKAAEEEFYADAIQKSHLNIVFIGHVDAGKSTMGGHILLLTGMVDKRTMEKYEREAKEQNRESWYLSWALDTNDDERAKGKTVECGRAFFETEKRRFTILDAPGHKNYVPSMISGANQADIAVLVISARKGEFETGFEKGGQTREHAMLAKTAGVKRMVVVINKMDDPTVMWSKERYDEILGKLTPFLKGCGFRPSTDLDFIPISGFTGANLKDRLTKEVCPWFEGPSLIEFLDSVEGIDRNDQAPFLFPITEKFKDQGIMGTIVSGKVEAGRIRKGKQVLLVPNRKLCEVIGIDGESEEEVPAATCGDNVRIRLKGVEEDEIARGFVLCDVQRPVQVVQSFEAQLRILEHKNIFCAGYSCVLHVHTLVEEVEVVALLHLIKGKKRSKKPPTFATNGQIVVARLETRGPVCLETYNSNKQLGRFTLRDEGKTIAMGKIIRLSESEEEAAVGAE